MLASARTRPHCFGIFHPKRDCFFLSAATEWEMMSWVRAVRRDHSSVGLLDFDVVAKLGQASFGKSVLVKRKPGAHDSSRTERRRYFTMKILNKTAAISAPADGGNSAGDVGTQRHERRIMTKAIHPFLVRVHYVFQTTEKLYLVMDFVPGADLFFHLQRFGHFSEPLVKVWMAELVLAVEYLHKLGIVYQELKPENGAPCIQLVDDTCSRVNLA